MGGGGGGKGGGGVTQTNVNYTYTVCALFAIAEGVGGGSVGTIWSGKDKSDASSLGLTYFNGTDTQSAFGYLTTNHSADALTYRNTAYLASGAFDLKDSPSIPNINIEYTGRLSGVNLDGTTSGDACPPDVVYELITDSKSCLGLSSSYVGSLTAWRQYCQAYKIYISPSYTEGKAARDMIESICKITNTGVYFSEGTVKFVPFCDVAATGNTVTFTPNLTAVYNITEDDISSSDSPLRLIRKSQSDAYNRVRVTYQNRSNDYNDSNVTADIQLSVEKNGVRAAPEFSFPEIMDDATARTVAQQLVQRASYVRNMYEFKVGWKYARLEPMDIVTITESSFGLVQEPVRIIEINEDENGFTIKAEEMNVGVHAAVTYNQEPSTGYKVDYNVSPGSANSSDAVIFEPPASLSGDPELWMAISGSNANWGGCNVWVSDDNATYKMAGTIYGSSRHGYTTSAISAQTSPDTVSNLGIDLTISKGSVDAGTTQNATDLVTLMYVGGEYISYRDASLTSAYHYNIGYLIRGNYGSTNGAHSSGVKVARLDNTIFKYAYDKKFIGRTIYIKFQSFNVYGGATETLAGLTPVTYSFTGTQISAVSGLVLEQAFTGSSVKVKWNVSDGAYNYTVTVMDLAGTTTYRTVSTINNRYEYTWQDTVSDGGPYRSIQIRVVANAWNGQSSTYSAVTATNSAPAALTGISSSGGYRSITISYNANTDPDLAGYQVWMSTTSGFTPGAGNLLFDGNSNKISTQQDPTGTAIPNTATTYYFRVAAYDVFGKTGLNVSSEFSVTSLLFSTGIGAGDISNAMLAAGAVDMAKFATGIRPPRVVTSLPTVDGVTYKNQDSVFLSTDGKLYRAVAGAWTKSTDGADIIANSITAGQIAAGAIGATQIAANAITTDKLLVSGRSLAINDDPDFTDSSVWQFVGSIGQASNASAAGAVSPNYAYCASPVDSYAYSLRFYPISSLKTYYLSAVLATNAGNNRQMSVSINYFDSSGTVVGSQTIATITPTNSWVRYGAPIGVTTGFTIPSTATKCKIYVVFQVSSSGSSSVTQAAQDFRLEEVLQGTLIQDGAIITNKLAANSVTTGKLAVGAVTANEIAANTITTNKIVVGAVTALQFSSVASFSGALSGNTSIGYSATNTVTTFTSTGAPVTMTGLVSMRWTAGGFGLAGWQIWVEVSLIINGTTQIAIAEVMSVSAAFDEAYGVVPIAWYQALSSGTHTIAMKVRIFISDATGTIQTMSGTFTRAMVVTVQENKV